MASLSKRRQKDCIHAHHRGGFSDLGDIITLNLKRCNMEVQKIIGVNLLDNVPKKACLTKSSCKQDYSHCAAGLVRQQFYGDIRSQARVRSYLF